jgi:uncharacterized membrane protein (Fun14 family)
MIELVVLKKYFLKGEIMVDAQAQASVGWLAKIKSSLHLDNFQFSSNKLIEIGMYLGFGFLIGYILKRFSSFVLIIVLTLLALFLLHQFEIINLSLNIDKLREFLGIQQAADSNILCAYWTWAKTNIILVLSFFIGFLIGIRLG